MKKINEINRQIEDLKKELSNVRGTETEVYARIVGYYRSVKNWNKGKREEYGERVEFNVLDKKTTSSNLTTQPVANKSAIVKKTDTKITEITSNPFTYSYFYRKTCPNCPPVKDYVSTLTMEGRVINVDENNGLKEASKHEVFTAPTVIFFNPDGREVFRANTVKSIKEALGGNIKSAVSL